MGERERALPTCSLLKGMNIIWSAEAIADLISLRAYIAEHNPAAARRTAQRIIELIEDVLTIRTSAAQVGYRVRANS